MADFNRAPFFAYVRDRLFRGFKGLRGPDQIKGLDFILDTWLATYHGRTPPTQFAYVLATAYHETAATMQPIREYGSPAYFTRMYDITGARPGKARELGNLLPGDGAKFPGMGFVQSTGRGNARRATKRLRELGIIGADVDFEKNPELLMEPQYAIHILFIGMEEGWFTGDTLDKEIDPNIDGDEHADEFRARRIVNGADRAELIAGYADTFLRALQAGAA